MNEAFPYIVHVVFLSSWLVMYFFSFFISILNIVDALSQREVERNYAGVWYMTSLSVLFVYFNIFMG